MHCSNTLFFLRLIYYYLFVLSHCLLLSKFKFSSFPMFLCSSHPVCFYTISYLFPSRYSWLYSHLPAFDSNTCLYWSRLQSQDEQIHTMSALLPQNDPRIPKHENNNDIQKLPIQKDLPKWIQRDWNNNYYRIETKERHPTNINTIMWTFPLWPPTSEPHIDTNKNPNQHSVNMTPREWSTPE